MKQQSVYRLQRKGDSGARERPLGKELLRTGPTQSFEFGKTLSEHVRLYNCHFYNLTHVPTFEVGFQNSLSSIRVLAGCGGAS